MSLKTTLVLSTMLIGRFIMLTLVVLLGVGSGISLTQGDLQPFAGPGEAGLSAASSPGDCDACKDCAEPCTVQTICTTACVSLALAPLTQHAATLDYHRLLAPDPDWQLPSAHLRTPTPPPRPSHIV